LKKIKKKKFFFIHYFYIIFNIMILVRGFYLQYQDDILKEPVKEWNVKVLKVNYKYIHIYIFIILFYIYFHIFFF